VSTSLSIVLRCADALVPKVRYVFDTLLMAAGIPAAFVDEPPETGPWVLYASTREASRSLDRCMGIAHCPESWRIFAGKDDVAVAGNVDDLTVVFSHRVAEFEREEDIAFDIAANAFYFLSSWSERSARQEAGQRRLFTNSVYARLAVPQDIVDQYLERLLGLLRALCARTGTALWGPSQWPHGADYTVVLSHDVDFVPSGFADNAIQAGKTVLRHLIRHRDPIDATRAAWGFARAMLRGRDPYGCVPEIIERERRLGVRASFQVAVGHRHPNDVNYRIEEDRVRDYLRAITDAGFDLCLHGSYRSTEDPAWYAEEVTLLTQRLGQPTGSRQHFLSFDYDALFRAQERAGIQFDMSMGYPDRPGPRAGFSYPYFPFCLEENRPFDVLQIALFLMDVTLRSYMNLKGRRAWQTIEREIEALRRKRGCASVVWHPIVFGGARDPGYDQLFWDMIEHVRNTGGVATDGRSINWFWRERASRYASFR
jgi:hypothetical protein